MGAWSLRVCVRVFVRLCERDIEGEGFGWQLEPTRGDESRTKKLGLSRLIVYMYEMI